MPIDNVRRLNDAIIHRAMANGLSEADAIKQTNEFWVSFIGNLYNGKREIRDAIDTRLSTVTRLAVKA